MFVYFFGTTSSESENAMKATDFNTRRTKKNEAGFRHWCRRRDVTKPTNNEALLFFILFPCELRRERDQESRVDAFTVVRERDLTAAVGELTPKKKEM